MRMRLRPLRVAMSRMMASAILFLAVTGRPVLDDGVSGPDRG